jgi:hypothetical protein
VVEEGVVGVVGKRPRRKWTTVARRKTIDEGKRKTKRNEDVKKKPDAKKLDAKKRHLLPLLLVVVVLRCPPRNSVGIGNARRNWSAA